jgi:single-stranded-DNA-specific exonuclease
MTRQVKVRPNIPEEADAALAGFHPVVRKLLYRHGIQTPEAAQAFLSPDFDLATGGEPKMADLERAADLIAAAVRAGETIGVFADYDADGIPGAALMSALFKKIGARGEFYIPHRNREGFGFSVAGADSLIARGARLIVTVDCGTADAAAVAYAKENGAAVIVTDHHEIHGDLPPADAVVNPKRADCPYDQKMLCGSGVAWKLAKEVLARFPGAAPAGWEKWLLDLAAIATVADMVPLVGENRAIARWGLHVLRKSPRPGIRALCAEAGVDQRSLSADDIGFSIAPRINAASRMGEPELAFRLLDAEDPAEAARLATELSHLNDRRKGVVAGIVKAVKERVESHLGASGEAPAAIVAGDPRWQPSLLGLAASSIADRFGRPVFLWGRGEGADALRGSCRAARGGSSVLAMMQAAAEALEVFGGHHAAGGFTVKMDAVDALPGLLAAAAESLPSGDAELWADDLISPSSVDRALAEALELAGPFGVGHEKPVFLLADAPVSAVRPFGADKTHARVTVGGVAAVGFGIAHALESRGLAAGSRISALVEIERARWAGREEIRLRIRELV